MAILIKAGTLITDQEQYQADILIDDTRIVDIRPDIFDPNAQVVNADGKLIFPGGVDPHTHFNLPMFDTVSSDDHYTGHKAAAFGGTTTVIDFISHDYPDLAACVEAWHARADPLAAIDFGFHMNITHFDDHILDQLASLLDMGISSIKVFTAYNHRLRLQDGEIFKVMLTVRDHGILTMLHAENGDVIEVLVAKAIAQGNIQPEWHAYTRPAWGAVEATLRGAALAAQADTSLYIVHMNVSGEVDQLAYARSKGVKVMGETCPQYLFFTEDDLRRPDGAKWICSPPMRKKEDNEQLWEGVSSGVIQVIGTDHCPFFYNGTIPVIYEKTPIAIPGKELGAHDFTKIPNGLPGVGDRLPILWTYGVRSGRITPNQFVALTSTNPAKIFGLYPQKGCLGVGSDADIVIWDPEKRVKYGITYAQHRTDYNLYEGWDLVGFPEKVFLRGSLLIDQGHWFGKPGGGRFIHRKVGSTI